MLDDKRTNENIGPSSERSDHELMSSSFSYS